MCISSGLKSSSTSRRIDTVKDQRGSLLPSVLIDMRKLKRKKHISRYMICDSFNTLMELFMCLNRLLYFKRPRHNPKQTKIYDLTNFVPT